MNDETTREIFPLPPLTSYRRDQNIRDILVHTSMKSQSGSPAATYPCSAPRCRTCAHVSATTIIAGPRHRSYTLEKPGECSGNALVNTFEPLRETRPVSLLQNISTSPDTEVRCVKQCRGTNDARRRDKMRLIFYLGTLRPHGLNVDFIFLNSLARAHFYPSVKVARTTVNLFNDFSCPIQNST